MYVYVYVCIYAYIYYIYFCVALQQQFPERKKEMGSTFRRRTCTAISTPALMHTNTRKQHTNIHARVRVCVCVYVHVNYLYTVVRVLQKRFPDAQHISTSQLHKQSRAASHDWMDLGPLVCAIAYTSCDPQYTLCFMHSLRLFWHKSFHRV